MRRRLGGRSRPILALGTIAASALVMTGCGKDTTPDLIFTSLDQCVASGMDKQVCQLGYDDAVHSNLTEAPQFNSLTACEAEFGDRKCVERAGLPATGYGGHSGIFSPLLGGFMLSSAITTVREYNDERRRKEEEHGTSSGPHAGFGGIYNTRYGKNVTTSRNADGTQIQNVLEHGKHSVNPLKVVARRGFGFHMRGGG